MNLARSIDVFFLVGTATSLVTLFFLPISSGAQYGLDCSFPIHRIESTCGNLLGDRMQFYEDYMQGCSDRYEKRACMYSELSRIQMNRRQPQSMVNFTSTGYRKIKAPDSLRAMLTEFWEKNKDNGKLEKWGKGNIFTNHWEAPTHMINVEDEELEGGGDELKGAIWHAAEEAIADWTTMKLRPSSLYGIRVYPSGAVLNPHVDRLPLVSSAIVNVAQDVDEPWPIEVYDRDDNAVNITMEPGDMVLYESGSLIHGRPFPLKGRYYANVFIHFEPIDHRNDDADFSSEEGIPPYLVPNSPEVAHWLEKHPNRWSKRVIEDDTPETHRYAAKGKIDKLKEVADDEKQLLFFQDENGWQPIHEAVRGGQLEALNFLIEQGADINARTNDGIGASVLNLAKTHLDPEDPVYVRLSELGAEDWEDEYEEEEEEEWDDDYEYYGEYFECDGEDCEYEDWEGEEDPDTCEEGSDSLNRPAYHGEEEENRTKHGETIAGECNTEVCQGE